MGIKINSADGIYRIFFSEPYAKYKTVVGYFISRKSTVIEWMILELIRRYSNDNECSSNISLKTIIEDILSVPDADILVKPSIIELIEINAIEDKDNLIDENISLDEVNLSHLALTQSGNEMQEKGLLPATLSLEEIVFIYDKLENDLKLESDTKINKLEKISKGIKLSNMNELVFDENRAKEILEDKKDKVKSGLFDPTSEIGRIMIKGKADILWRNLEDEIEINENGKLELTNYKDKEIFNKLLIENISDLFKSDLLATLGILEINQSFDYNNFKNLLKIFHAESISQKLKNVLNSEDFVIVNNEFNKLMDYDSIKSNLLLIYGKEEFFIDIKDKKMIVHIDEEMPFNNCIALNNSKTNVCIADFEVYNDFDNKNIIFGYSYLYNNIDLKNLKEELINKYISYDYRIIFLNLFISKDRNIFRDNLAKWFNNIEKIEEGLNFLSSIINDAKNIKLDDDEAKNIFINIISKNNKTNDINNIEKLKEYLNILNNGEILDKDSLNKVYINIIKNNYIYFNNLEEFDNFYNFLNEYKIPFNNIENIIKNLYKNSFIDMIVKYANNTEHRYKELSSIEKSINSFANNIKSISSNLKLQENDLFKSIYPSDLSKKVIEYYRNSNNKKDTIMNNIKNIDRIINDIASKLGIKKETFKENKTIRDILENIENMKEDFKNLKDNTQNQNKKKNKKNKKK